MIYSLYLTFAILALQIIPITQTSSQAETTIYFTRTDGTLWKCSMNKPSPEHPTLVSYDQIAIGSHTNYYGRSKYTIDANRNTLIKNGIEVGPLIWPATGRVWDVQSHYGFAIYQGQGWLATTDSDADNQSFLLKVNLQTATVDYVDFIDGPSLFQINGMIVQPPFFHEAPGSSDEF